MGCVRVRSWGRAASGACRLPNPRHKSQAQKGGGMVSKAAADTGEGDRAERAGHLRESTRTAYQVPPSGFKAVK